MALLLEITFGAMLVVFLGFVFFKVFVAQPKSQASYSELLQKLDQLDRQGTNFEVELKLDESSAMLFFSKEADELLDVGQDGVRRVFERPKECLGNACVCNCLELNVQTNKDESRVVSCVKAKCAKQNYAFIESNYYDKDSPRNKGRVVHNLDGGLSTVKVVLSRYQKGLVLICPPTQCPSEELKRFLTFDMVLRNGLQLCAEDKQDCPSAFQTFSQIIDPDRAAQIVPYKEEDKDKTNLTLMEKETAIWSYEQPLCLKNSEDSSIVALTYPALLRNDVPRARLLVANNGAFEG